MMQYLVALFLMFVFYTSSKAQGKTGSCYGPRNITRAIKQDKKGNIWIASWDGIFRYDGKSFTKVTSKLDSAHFPTVISPHFMDVLEDRKGKWWFGSAGGGVHYYDGKSFQNFTTNDGLLNNEIGRIYEDKAGNIWFGANGGIICYDGKIFRNYVMSRDSIVEDRTRESVPNGQRPIHEVNSIIEDKAGVFWFGTRDNTFVYDGKIFSVFTRDGKPFTNVRCIMEDKKGNIWLAGADGLWRYDGRTFTNFTQKFVSYVYEDKKGNIWTSSEECRKSGCWALSRYDGKSLSDSVPTVTKIHSGENGIWDILEVNDGSIWFGYLDGVYRYNGKTSEDSFDIIALH